MRRQVQRFGGLVAYVDRIMALSYPEFAWTSGPARAVALAEAEIN